MCNLYLVQAIISKVIFSCTGQTPGQLTRWTVVRRPSVRPSVRPLAIYKINFFSRTKGGILVKLHRQHPGMVLYQNCSKKLIPCNRKEKLKKSSRHKLLLFGMQHCLVDLYKVCANHVHRIKIGPAPGVTCLTQSYIGKTFKNLLVQNCKPQI